MTFIIVVIISRHPIKVSKGVTGMGPGLENWKAMVLHSARKLKFLGELWRLSTLEFFSDQVSDNVCKWGLGWASLSFPGDLPSNCDLLSVMPEAPGQGNAEGKLGGEGEMDVTLSETGRLWWLLQKKQEQSPCQCPRMLSPSSRCGSRSWPGIPSPARLLSCQRAKACGWSEALHSQTVRNPAGLCLSVMDYRSPISWLYKSIYQQGLLEYLLWAQLPARWLEGNN